MDSLSRFLCEGTIGLYIDKEEEPQLEHVFGTADIVREYHSYYDRVISPYYLKAMSDAVVLQIERDLSDIGIYGTSEFFQVDNALYNYILQRRTAVTAIRALGLQEGGEQLDILLPGAFGHFKLRDLTTFFNRSISTVSRWKRKNKFNRS